MNGNLRASAPIFWIRSTPISTLYHISEGFIVWSLGTRLLSKRFPFEVYYKVIDKGVLVTSVLDCRRNPNWIRETLMQR